MQKLMRRLSVLLFIAILTFAAVIYVKRLDLITHAWLWVVGLAAPVIGLIKRLAAYLGKWFDEKILHKTPTTMHNPPGPPVT